MSKEGREGRHRRWSEEESEGGPWRRETRDERREARDQLTHADAHAHAHAGDAHADDAQPTSTRSRDSSYPFGPSIWTRAELETTSSGCRRGSQKPIQL